MFAKIHNQRQLSGSRSSSQKRPSERNTVAKPVLAAVLCMAFSVQAIAQDICDDVEAARQERVSQVEQEVDLEHKTLEEARKALRECQINLNAQMSSMVGSGALAELLKNVGKDLSQTACDEIKRKAEEAARKVEQAAKDKAKQAGINKVSEVAQNAYDGYQSGYESQVPGSLTQPGDSTSKSAWDSLGKLLSN